MNDDASLPVASEGVSANQVALVPTVSRDVEVKRVSTQDSSLTHSEDFDSDDVSEGGFSDHDVATEESVDGRVVSLKSDSSI